MYKSTFRQFRESVIRETELSLRQTIRVKCDRNTRHWEQFRMKKKVKPAIRTFFPTLFAKVESKNEWKTFLSARCNAICFVTDRYINPLFHSRHFRLNSSWHFDGVLAMIISAPQMPTIRPKPPASPHMCVAYNCYVYLLMFYAVDVVDVASCQQTLARHKLNVSPTRNFR